MYLHMQIQKTEASRSVILIKSVFITEVFETGI